MKKTIELTQKEAYVLWSVICWFSRPIATDTLKYKLAKVVDIDSKFRRKMDKKLEKQIIKRIVELGISIKKDHPEWAE